MKTFILAAAILFTVNASAADIASIPENKKVVETFKELYKDVSNVTWTETKNYFEAYFTDGNIKTRVLFDTKGHVVQTIRYYKESNLPTKVRYHINKTYKGKEIWGVTEVTNNKGTNFRIVLKDAQNWYHVNADSYSNSETVKKYKRGDK
ncbi:hypothetical protein GCM10027051_19740 [Niabella terrae]